MSRRRDSYAQPKNAFSADTHRESQEDRRIDPSKTDRKNSSDQQEKIHRGRLESRSNQTSGGGIMNEIEHSNISEEQLQFPEWQTPLLEAVLEFDPDKLPQKIQYAEAVIFQRLEKIRLGNHSQSEEAAMQDALSVIRRIRKDRLGYS
jgi:hypothetical protein